MTKEGVLTQLAQFHAFGIVEPLRKAIAIKLKYKMSSFNVLASRWKKEGLVELPSGTTIRITDKGLATVPRAVTNVDMQTTDDVVKFCQANLKLTGGAVRVLNLFVSSHDHSATHRRTDLARRLGMESGTKLNSFKVYLSALAGAGLVEYPGKDTVRLSPLMLQMLSTVTTASSNDVPHDEEPNV